MRQDGGTVGGRRRPPSGPWVMEQSWLELLFAHWAVPHDVLRPLVPEPLVLEEFDGSAWLGLTPFRIAGLRPRLLPPLPGVSAFPEMNLRTYVRFGGVPGVFFFTLEAGSRVAVLGARTFWRLPYRLARMDVERRDGWIDYRSSRVEGDARFEGRYRPTGPASRAAPDSLEHFLAERYALYAVLRDGRVLRGDIDHDPWELAPAEAEVAVQTVSAAHGVDVGGREPLLHYSQRQDTRVWAPRIVGG